MNLPTPVATRVAAALWALAAMTTATAVQAQTAGTPTVQLYGVLDAAAGTFQDAGQPRVSKVESGRMSSNYLGLRGSESIMGNLKARFALEAYQRVDTGEVGRTSSDVFWGRNAYVGLQGDFGTVTLGRNLTPFYLSTLIFNAFGDSPGFSPSVRQVFAPSTGLPFLGDTSWSNSILYASNDHGGVSFNLLANLGEGAAGATGRNLGGNVVYLAGPWGATAAYQQVKNGAGAATPPGWRRQDALQLGAFYDLSVVKLFAQYTLEKTHATVDTQTKIYGIGASMPIGSRGKALLQYGQARPDTSLTAFTNKTLTLGYDHTLSKNTDVYAVAMNDKLAGTVSNATPKNNGNTLAIGVRLRF